MVIISTDIEHDTPIMYECDGPCNGTYVALHNNIMNRTHNGETFCPRCWTILGYDADKPAEEPKNQVYW